MRIQKRLEKGPPLLLDGAMGTELSRRGVDVSLPLWSASILDTHPEIVLDIHKEYVWAGAEILTTNTFRTTPRVYKKVMESETAARRRARKLTRRAVRAAKEAAGENVFVAGCIAPLEDCYHPELFPGSLTGEKEFSELSRWLVEKEGVDLLLMETMGRVDEMESALKAARDVLCPKWVSFILLDDRHLLGGDELIESAKKTVDMGVDVLLLNCSNLYTSTRALEILLNSVSVPAGIYPNLGKSKPSIEGFIDELYHPDEFVEQMKHAIELGARIVGCCCGSSPEHTRLLRTLIDSFS